MVKKVNFGSVLTKNHNLRIFDISLHQLKPNHFDAFGDYRVLTTIPYHVSITMYIKNIYKMNTFSVKYVIYLESEYRNTHV